MQRYERENSCGFSITELPHGQIMGIVVGRFRRLQQFLGFDNQIAGPCSRATRLATLVAARQHRPCQVAFLRRSAPNQSGLEAFPSLVILVVMVSALQAFRESTGRFSW